MRRSPMHRIPYLDGWRGLAILCVLCGHFFYLGYVNWARFGVEVFFVLSGRLMAEILFLRRAPLGPFYLRRIARIYPGLLVFCLIGFAACFGTAQQVGWGQLLAALSLTSNYAMYRIGMPDVFGHLWSLCIEEHMYLLLGLIAFVTRRYRVPALPLIGGIAAIFAVQGAILTARGAEYYQVYWRSDVRGASLLIGAFVFLLVQERGLRSGQVVPDKVGQNETVQNQKRGGGVLRGMAAIGFGLLAVRLNFYAVPDAVKYTLGTGCLAVSLALALLPAAPLLLHRALALPGIATAGILSYALYLWQQPFYILTHAGYGSLPMLVAAVLCALLSYRFVEKPLRSRLNALIEATSLAAGAPDAVPPDTAGLRDGRTVRDAVPTSAVPAQAATAGLPVSRASSS